MERERICSHSFPLVGNLLFPSLYRPVFSRLGGFLFFRGPGPSKNCVVGPAPSRFFSWSFPMERLFEKHLRCLGIVYLKNIEGLCFLQWRYMIFTVRVYVKNIEKYKGIYAISKIYLGLLRLPTLPLTLPLGKASQETKNKKKKGVRAK